MYVETMKTVMEIREYRMWIVRCEEDVVRCLVRRRCKY